MEDAAPLLSENGLEEEKRPKRRKPGIVYLSTIPPNMNVAKIRQYFSSFGTLDRVFLQAVDKGGYVGFTSEVCYSKVLLTHVAILSKHDKFILLLQDGTFFFGRF